jgi:uncharacterized protein YdhG (YjbR/CyaY superfamily)
MSKTSYINISEYISLFPKDVQMVLKELRRVIKTAAPESSEAISYGMPTFRLNGKNLVHFAAYAMHIGFYPTPSGITAFKSELSEYRTSKGAVQFPINESLPLKLIGRVVKFRVLENNRKILKN